MLPIPNPPAVLAAAALCLAAALAAGPARAAPSCWTADGRVPRTLEGLPSGHPSLAGIEAGLDAAEALLRADARINAQPDVRIRLFRLIEGGQPRLARVAAKAYDHVVWGRGACDLIPQADRIGPVTAVSISFNQPARTLNVVVDEDGMRGYEAPLPGAPIRGWPVWDGCVVMTPDGRAPWRPMRTADWAAAESVRRARALEEHAQALRQALKPIDEAAMQPAIAQLRRTDPAGAERLVAQMAALRLEQQKRAAAPDPVLQAQRAEAEAFEQWRAGLQGAAADAPVRLGQGRFGLAAPQEPSGATHPLVRVRETDPRGPALQVVHVCAAPEADARAALEALDLGALARRLGWKAPLAP